MGRFDFFSKKESPEELDTGLHKGPTWLDGRTIPVTGGRKPTHKEWRGQLVSAHGNKEFRICYHGHLNTEDDHIVCTETTPCLIVATDVLSGEEILLFDGGRHGYNAMLCDEYSAEQLSNRSANAIYREADGNDVFEICFSAYYHIDFDSQAEEFIGEVDEAGFLSLKDGNRVSLAEVKRNAFDAVAIFVKNPQGKSIQIFSEELA